MSYLSTTTINLVAAPTWCLDVLEDFTANTTYVGAAVYPYNVVTATPSLATGIGQPARLNQVRV